MWKTYKFNIGQIVVAEFSNGDFELGVIKDRFADYPEFYYAVKLFGESGSDGWHAERDLHRYVESEWRCAGTVYGSVSKTDGQ